MYISRLHLRAFGKFIHRKIYFGSKFNIVYGENETGKSTLHNFIQAIMYGFEEDGTKYNKYKPWSSPLYKGTLELTDEEEKYLISKDFLLGTLQVFKNEYPLEDIDSPGEHFFKISRLSYNNTVSISQLGNKTEGELADELKRKIINLSSTKDEEISIDRILQRLYRIKDEAGSESNDKTLLGQYSLRLSDLSKARENSLNSKRQVMFLAMEKKKLQSKIHELNKRIEEKNKEIYDYELSLEKRKFLKAQPVKGELDKINNELNSFKGDLVNCSREDYREASETEMGLASMKNERLRMLEEKEEGLSQLQLLEGDLANYIPQDFDIEKFNEEYRLFKENKDKLNSLKLKIKTGRDLLSSINIDEINKFLDDYREAEELNRKIEINKLITDNDNYTIMKKFGKKQGLASFFAGLLATALLAGAGASCYYAYYYNNFDYYYGSIGFLLALIFYIISFRKRNRAISAKKEIESMECEYADYTLTTNKLLDQKEEIIKKHSCQDFDAMAGLYQNKSIERDLYQEKAKLLNYDEKAYDDVLEENKARERDLEKTLSRFNLSLSEDNIIDLNQAYQRKDLIAAQTESLRNKIQQISNDIIRLDREINFEERRFDMILKANGVDDIEAFRKAVDLCARYSELMQQKEYNEKILANILGPLDYQELEIRTLHAADELKEINKDEIQVGIFRLNEEKTRLENSISDIHKEIEDLEKNTRSLTEIEEEIDFYEEKISTFKNKIKIAEIAAEKISKISDSIKGDFMPLLKKSISDNFAYLTGDKYYMVDIDEDMNISVMSREDQDRKIELENLSGGTLDQLYLSLRLALSNILSGNKNIPLILDDSFVQYDTRRLKKSLEMLSRESERRQVILFTCQEREADLSKQMNIRFNYIKL